MIEIISTDQDRFTFKQDGKIKVMDKQTRTVYHISSYKTGEVCATSSSGHKTYSTGWDNHLDWFPKDEQEKVNHAKCSFDRYIYDGGNSAARFDDDYWDTWSKNFEAKMNKVEEQVEQVEQACNKSISAICNGSSVCLSGNEIVVNGKHYERPKNASISVNNGTVKINGKKAVAIEDKNSSDHPNNQSCAVDNSRFPADASCQDPINKNEEIVLFDSVTYAGHTIPKCPGMICNSSGEATNIVETNTAVYCNGYQLIEGEWKKNFKAKLKCLFK